MHRLLRTGIFHLGLMLLPLSVMGQSEGLLFTGEVYSQQAQEIFVPATNNWQARISMMVPEGTKVKPGDTVVEFDGSDAARQLEQTLEAQRTELAKTERDFAKLEQELNQAEYQLQQAQVVLDLAILKAEVPAGLIGALDHAENQLAKERALSALEDAESRRKDLIEQTEERKRQAELDQKKGENQLELWREMLESFSVIARQPGYMIYGIHPWNRTKFQEGDTVRTSFRVAQVADTSDLAVKIWINSIDRPKIDAGLPMVIMLDALPDREYAGTLESISDSGARRGEWGGALYYEAIVLFDSEDQPELLPGMSALVEPR